MKGHKNVILMTAVIAFVSMGNIIPAAAQTTGSEIILINGLGAEITQLIISPSKDQYAGDRNSYGQAIQLSDQDQIVIEMPGHFLRYSSFDIKVISRNRQHVTRSGVRLDFDRGTPVLMLSETGKDSTITFVAAIATKTATAAGTVLLLTCTRSGRNLMGRIVTSAPYGSYGGVRRLLSLPLQAGLAGGLLGGLTGHFLTPKGLDVQVSYIN